VAQAVWVAMLGPWAPSSMLTTPLAIFRWWRGCTWADAPRPPLTHGDGVGLLAGQSADAGPDDYANVPGVRGYIDAGLGDGFATGGHGEVGELVKALGLLAEVLTVMLGKIEIPYLTGDLGSVVAGVEVEMRSMPLIPFFAFSQLSLTLLPRGLRGAHSGDDYSFFIHLHKLHCWLSLNFWIELCHNLPL
jgi:hypothetical protein